jgi:cysteinyl-tRNA synthetase
MSKSKGNFKTLREMIKSNISPMAFRFWVLMAHYRSPMNWNQEALEGAEIALKRLYKLYIELDPSPELTGKEELGKISIKYQQEFKEYLEDDLDTPRALSLLWDIIKDENLSPVDKKATILNFDKVLGLGFENLKEEKIPEEIIKIAEERELARKNKNFKKSDDLRDKIISLGYEIKDSSEGYKISKI